MHYLYYRPPLDGEECYRPSVTCHDDHVVSELSTSGHVGCFVYKTDGKGPPVERRREKESSVQQSQVLLLCSHLEICVGVGGGGSVHR